MKVLRVWHPVTMVSGEVEAQRVETRSLLDYLIGRPSQPVVELTTIASAFGFTDYTNGERPYMTDGGALAIQGVTADRYEAMACYSPHGWIRWEEVEVELS